MIYRKQILIQENFKVCLEYHIVIVKDHVKVMKHWSIIKVRLKNPSNFKGNFKESLKDFKN